MPCAQSHVPMEMSELTAKSAAFSRLQAQVASNSRSMTVHDGTSAALKAGFQEYSNMTSRHLRPQG